VEYSEIGLWSQAKLDIIAKYAKAYSTILAKKEIFTHVYVDAFAGPGLHRAKLTGHLVAGSPLNALEVQPPFAEYHFIDLDNKKVRALEEIAADHPDVQLYHGDANEKLVENIFPNLTYESFRRALCLLDPYGLHLNTIRRPASGTTSIRRTRLSGPWVRHAVARSSTGVATAERTG
jgi:three-Cys-motif partner protein